MKFNRQAADRVFLAALKVREGKYRIRGLEPLIDKEPDVFWPAFDEHTDDVLALLDALKCADVLLPEDPNDHVHDPLWILAYPEHPLNIREVSG